MDLLENINPVELLRRQYLQCLDPECLVLPRPEVLRMPETQNQIYKDMFDASRLQYPPPERYRFRALKRIIAAIEEAIEDPEEDVCNYLHSENPCSESEQTSNFAPFYFLLVDSPDSVRSGVSRLDDTLPC